MNQEGRATILWLTGWSMPNSVFDRLGGLLPDFDHVSVDYSEVTSSEELIEWTEQAANNILSTISGPLLIGGWSLGGILAIRLAAQGLADGLILFSTTAKFTRPKGQSHLGWADTYVRQMIAGLAKDRQATEIKFWQMMFTESEIDRTNPPLLGNWTTAALIAGLEVLRSLDLLTQLPEIGARVFLVHGIEDRICPYAAAEELQRHLPQAQLFPVADSGHAPFLGREAHVAESIRSWWHEQ
jgi:Predicted hydrolases or acyltransferases (alpha/beta hydrolase superfamily)